MYKVSKEKGDSRLAKANFFYEASLHHQSLLWQKYKRKGTIWTQHINGALLEIGKINNLPVVIWINFVRIDDKDLLLFYDVTSRVSDRKMVEKWLKSNTAAKLWTGEKDIRKFNRPVANFNFEGINGLVGADPNEQAILKEKYGLKQVETGVVKVGELSGNPVLIELTKVHYKKKKIVFWWVCSRMSDLEQVEQWMKDHKLYDKIGKFENLALQ